MNLNFKKCFALKITLGFIFMAALQPASQAMFLSKLPITHMHSGIVGHTEEEMCAKNYRIAALKFDTVVRELERTTPLPSAMIGIIIPYLTSKFVLITEIPIKTVAFRLHTSSKLAICHPKTPVYYVDAERGRECLPPTGNIYAGVMSSKFISDGPIQSSRKTYTVLPGNTVVFTDTLLRKQPQDPVPFDSVIAAFDAPSRLQISFAPEEDSFAIAPPLGPISFYKQVGLDIQFPEKAT